MGSLKDKLGLSANGLKIIAITAMLIDHIAYKFLTEDIVLIYCMRMIGRFTAPIMCFFIAEGFYHTKNIRKYAMRLGIAAVLSHFPYVYFVSGNLLDGIRISGSDKNFHTSVIYTLFLGLTALIIWNNTKINDAVKAVLIAAACMLAEYGDWGGILVVWILIFGIFRNSRKLKLSGFAVTGIYVWLIPIISASSSYNQIYMTCNLGIYLVIPLICLYNGTLGKIRKLKWLFYAFYPLHMLILGLIYYNFLT